MNATQPTPKNDTATDALMRVIGTTLAALAVLALIGAIPMAEAMAHMTILLVLSSVVIAVMISFSFVFARRSAAPARATLQ